jgi:pimeloyl-ACP methyl ester carboxylesterase
VGQAAPRGRGRGGGLDLSQQQINKQQVLALPGLLCDEYVWRAQIAGLADVADVTVADVSRHDDLNAMARAALDLVDGPVHVVGHSMGGRVAFEIWRIAPERVRSLVVMDTGVHGATSAEPANRQRLLDVAAHDGMRALADAWLPPMVHPSRRGDDTLMQSLRDMVMRATPESHARQIGALLNRPDATALLGTITVPTLVVVGRDDEWSPLAQHEQIAAAISGARLVVVENSGHMVTVERPDEVTALLREWLREFGDEPSV